MAVPRRGRCAPAKRGAAAGGCLRVARREPRGEPLFRSCTLVDDKHRKPPGASPPTRRAGAHRLVDDARRGPSSRRNAPNDERTDTAFDELVGFHSSDRRSSVPLEGRGSRDDGGHRALQQARRERAFSGEDRSLLELIAANGIDREFALQNGARAATSAKSAFTTIGPPPFGGDPRLEDARFTVISGYVQLMQSVRIEEESAPEYARGGRSKKQFDHNLGDAARGPSSSRAASATLLVRQSVPPEIPSRRFAQPSSRLLKRERERRPRHRPGKTKGTGALRRRKKFSRVGPQPRAQRGSEAMQSQSGRPLLDPRGPPRPQERRRRKRSSSPSQTRAPAIPKRNRAPPLPPRSSRRTKKKGGTGPRASAIVKKIAEDHGRHDHRPLHQTRARPFRPPPSPQIPARE